MSKKTRTKACEMAAQVMQGCGMDGDIAARVMSLCIFFENYIDLGAAETDDMMKLLPQDEVVPFVVIEGGK